jgi:hypothetical protein
LRHVRRHRLGAPAAVYKHLEWLIPTCRSRPHVVRAGNIRADTLAGENRRSKRFVTVPFYLMGPKGEEGVGRRQCTASRQF